MSETITHSLVRALQAVPGFDTLGDADLLAVVGASVNLLWSAGAVVYDHGDPVEGIYVVLTGRVRLSAPGGEAREVGPGHPFGHDAALAGVQAHTGRAAVVESSELMVVPLSTLRPLLERHPGLHAGLRATAG